MHFLIQDNLFYGRNEANLIESLNRLDYSFDYFKQIPFVGELEFTNGNPPSNSMIFGSVKTAQIAKKYNFNPGSFHNENHDYEIYSKHYRENLLNWTAKIQKFADPVTDDYFFCRPTEDTKTFTGKVFTKKDWENFVHYSLTNGHTTSLNTETPIMVCKPTEIYQEVRCFVVKGEIITASFYKFGNRIQYQECLESDILDFAKEMVQTFSLADAFVIDVCRTPNGLKIVECGCINCAGFYNINIQKLLFTLNEQFSIC